MPTKLIRETVQRFCDERGVVFEPLPGECLATQRNSHVVVSRPGAVRGNHYHLKGTETLVVCGPALVRIRHDGITEDITIPPENIYRLVIPPKVAHAIKNTGSEDSLLVAFNTEPHDREKPDLVEEVLIPW